jgi:DNA-binding transcriptional LysR family regulator
MPKNWPDLGSLELLTQVANQGGIGAAAKFCGINQPNASRLITSLEKAVGVQLVLRTASGSRLTEAGSLVVEWASPLLAGACILIDGTAALRKTRDSAVVVGASMTIAEHLAPRWLGTLRHHRPTTRIKLEVRNSDDICRLVMDGTFGLGFVESPHIDPNLSTQEVARDELVVVVAPDHPWALKGRRISREELAETPLVVREAGSGTRSTLDCALEDLSQCDPALELSSNSAVRAAAVAGIGPAALSSLAVANDILTGQLVPVTVDGVNLSRKLHVIWRGPRILSGPARDLVGIACARPGETPPKPKN